MADKVFIKDFRNLTKNDVSEAGGKGASLGEMTQAGIPVPPGFVVLASAFEKFLEETDLNAEIDTILHTVNHKKIHTVEKASEDIQALILREDMPRDLGQEISKAFKKLNARYVAVRSSATAEDSSSDAWAGQLDTFLNTTEKELLENVKRCWASLFTPRAIFYRFEKKLHKKIISVAVVVQKMVQSEVSGIAFSVHPVTEDRNQMIIEAGFGLGEAVVSGQITPDSYVLEKVPFRIIDKNVSEQNRMLAKAQTGNEWVDLSLLQGSKQKLSDSQIKNLGKLILGIEEHYGFPVDTEWAREGNKFFITQARPITTLVNIGSADANQITVSSVLEFDDPWMIAEDIPDIDFNFSQIWLSSFVNDLEKTVGRNYARILCVYKGYNIAFYYGQKDSDDFANHVLGMILKDPGFGQKMNKQIRFYSDRLKKISERIEPQALRRMSNKQLADFYQELDDLHTTLYTWGWLPNAVDMFHGNFTSYLKEVLKPKLKNSELNQALLALSTFPEKSIIDQEQDSFLRLAVLYAKGNGIAFKKALRTHTNKYFYLKHLWIGKHGVYDEKYYLTEIKKHLKAGEDPEKILKEKEAAFKRELELRRQYLKKLKLAPKQVAIFDVYAEFAVTKVYRRDAQLFWAYRMDFLFAELGRRFKLPIMAVRFMSPEEVAKGLDSGKIEPELKNELKKRVRMCAYYAEKDRDVIFVGKDAQFIAQSIQNQQVDEVKELHGQTACLGKAKGVAKIVNSVRDMKKMKAGEILVSIATNPDIVPAMKLAAAIVTEQGGITSHAAIVSRELGTPCVIGTKIATKVLRDGDVIEVDANKGIVKILERK